MSDLNFQPHLGKTDTSQEAALNIAPELSKRRKMVLSATLTPRTGSEIAEALGLPQTSVRPRLTELSKHGYIKDTGKRRKNNYGNNEIVWIKKDN